MSVSRRACRRFYASVVWPLFKYVKPMRAPHSSFLLPSHPLWRNEGSLVEASAQSQQTVSKHKSGIGDFMAPRFRSWFPLTAVLLLESRPRPAFRAACERAGSRKQHQVCSSSRGARQEEWCSEAAVWLFEQWLRDSLWTLLIKTDLSAVIAALGRLRPVKIEWKNGSFWNCVFNIRFEELSLKIVFKILINWYYYYYFIIIIYIFLLFKKWLHRSIKQYFSPLFSASQKKKLSLS